MIDSLAIIINGILALIVMLISSKGSLLDNRFKSWTKRFTKRGKWVIGLSFGIIVFSVLQLIHKNVEENHNRRQDIINRRDRDSIMTAKINEETRKNTKLYYDDFSQALLKYNMEFDAVKKTLEIIRKSPKIEPREEEPIIAIPRDGFQIIKNEHNLNFYSLSFVVTNGSAIVHSIDVAISRYKSGKEISGFISQQIMLTDLRIAEGTGISKEIFVRDNGYDEMILVIKFQVSSLSGKLKKQVTEVLAYDVRLNQFKILDNQRTKDVFVKASGL